MGREKCQPDRDCSDTCVCGSTCRRVKEDQCSKADKIVNLTERRHRSRYSTLDAYVTMKTFVFFAHAPGFKRMFVVFHEQFSDTRPIFSSLLRRLRRNIAIILVIMTKACTNGLQKLRHMRRRWATENTPRDSSRRCGRLAACFYECTTFQRYGTNAQMSNVRNAFAMQRIVLQNALETVLRGDLI